MIRSWLAGPTALMVAVSTVSLLAQEPAGDTSAPVATIQRLFDAMNAADTAATRRAFVPLGRVVPLRADGASAPLSVDQFTAYVATIPAGSWHERIWEPRTELLGRLAHVWFEYDVVRADTVRQCGRQSVQLTQSGDGWRIMSMAFVPSTAPCKRVVALNVATPLTVTNGRVIATTYRGRPALKLAPLEGHERDTDQEMYAVITDTDFQDGVIEVDVSGARREGYSKATDVSGFKGIVGISFRVHDGAAERFYIRPENSRIDDQVFRNRSTQYESDPDYPWNRLRQESPDRYESYVDVESGAWTSLRIEVSGSSAKLFVNGAAQPSLVVNDLKHGTSRGKIALWARISTEAYFANLRVQSLAGAPAAAWPAARARHHLTYDPTTQHLLLLGGAQPRIEGAAEDTSLWDWDGARWRTLAAGPPSRANDGAAYDQERSRLVIYGGSGLTKELDDTWEWDGREWRLASPSGPGARAHHAMVYDPVRRQIVLFGNSDNATANDTWGWDGRAWKQLANDGPPRRGVYGFAFDEKRGVAVLFGGYGSQSVVLNDTWEWNGQRWSRVSTVDAPSPRWDTYMAYDPIRERIVLFGGRSRAGNLGDTWEYDGRAWTRLDVDGPSPRNGHAMAFDPRAKAILLFGGRNEPTYLNDLWAFDGVWKRVPSPQP